MGRKASSRRGKHPDRRTRAAPTTSSTGQTGSFGLSLQQKRSSRTSPRTRQGADPKHGSKGHLRGPQLSDEQQRLVISSIEAGGTLKSAARAAGISERTLRELRQRARGKHPTRSPLPHLKKFFDDVDRAIGLRLLANEIWISKNDPKFALKYLHASLEGDDQDEEPPRLPTANELQAEIDTLVSSGAFRSPRCQRDCPCPYHPRKETDK